jgi:hypothetical protein
VTLEREIRFDCDFFIMAKAAALIKDVNKAAKKDGMTWKAQHHVKANGAAKKGRNVNKSNENLNIEGKWNLEDSKTGRGCGKLTIDRGLNNASFSCNRLVEVEGLDLKSSARAKTLIYKGETCEWKNCCDDFRVKMGISYIKESDRVEGSIYVTTRRVPDVGPDCESGGSFSFIGARALLWPKRNDEAETKKREE